MLHWCAESLCGCRGAISNGSVRHHFGVRAKRTGRAIWAAPADGADELYGPCAAVGGHLWQVWGLGVSFLHGFNHAYEL